VAFVWAILGFAALITLHEGGHFVAAKAVGMRVERFSLFFGPMFVSRTIGETEYGIGVIPLGGYVKITGMSPEEVFEEPSVERRAYVNQPVWKRIVVIAAGPAVNLVVAFLIFFGVILHEGKEVIEPGYAIASIQSGTAAAGTLKPGDQIISVDGHAVRGTRTAAEKTLSTTIDASTCAGARTDGCVASPAVTMVVRREGKLLAFRLSPHYSTAAKHNLVGFSYGAREKAAAISVPSAAHYGIKQMGTEVSATFRALSHLYQSKERKQLHSIAGITVATEEATKEGAADGLWLLGGISLALAVFNLLPFLPLDGGHIFWALMEKARRGRKVSLATMERASYVGLALMLCLVVIGFSNDISTFIHGGNFLQR
jgi:regulator of sigma E protease